MLTLVRNRRVMIEYRLALMDPVTLGVNALPLNPSYTMEDALPRPRVLVSILLWPCVSAFLIK